MVTKLSDIVWLIHPEQDTIFEMIERLEEYARQMCSAKNMQVKIDLPDILSQLHIPQEARRNIYLFCKEAINNAVKYSHGTLLTLQVKEIETILSFSVLDNGHGFDALAIKRGNGIVNMQKRAEEIGASLKLKSRAGQGTQIELQYKVNA